MQLLGLLRRVRTARTVAPALLCAAVFLIPLFAPLPGDLSAQGQRVLAVVALAVALWLTELLAPAVTGLLAVALLVVLGGVEDMGDAVAGFANPVGYFLIGILGLGLAVRKSGLAERMALFFVARARGSPRSLFLQMLLSFPAMTLVLPSANTRNAILFHAYEQVLELWRVPEGAPLARAIMMGLGSLNRLASTALLTGGVSPIAAAALLGDFSWSRWLVLLGPPYYLLLAVGGGLLFALYRPERWRSPQQPPADGLLTS